MISNELKRQIISEGHSTQQGPLNSRKLDSDISSVSNPILGQGSIVALNLQLRGGGGGESKEADDSSSAKSGDQVNQYATHNATSGVALGALAGAAAYVGGAVGATVAAAEAVSGGTFLNTTSRVVFGDWHQDVSRQDGSSTNITHMSGGIGLIVEKDRDGNITSTTMVDYEEGGKKI